MRGIHRLSRRDVDKAKRPLCDGGNLWIVADGEGPKSWAFRFMREGVAREMGLGPVHTVDLDDARQRAANARRLLLDGIDPIDARDRRRLDAKLAAARLMTFRDCADAYMAAHKATWRNAKHRQQWANTLSTYCHPVIGDLPVADIQTDLVLKVLRPIWMTKPETARRVRMRIETVLAYAISSEARTGPNPARWQDHIANLLPSRGKVARVQHHPALPYAELGDFMAALRRQEGVSPRALEFAILTAARTGEVIGATWAEIDLDAKVWTVPAGRMKASREHRVPLSDRAVAILEKLPREGEYVFAGGKEKAPLSNMAMLRTLERMGRDDLTTHGFRSTFRDWAGEQTAYPREVIETALAHTLKDKTEAAYRRGDMLEKRRRLMADWARFADAPSVLAGSVTTMQRAAS